MLIVGLLSACADSGDDQDGGGGDSGEVGVVSDQEFLGHRLREVSAEQAPTVELDAQPDPHGGWNLHLTTQRFTFTPPDQNGRARAGQGHAHDSLSNAPRWVRLLQESQTPTLVGTLGLAAAIGIIAVAYVAATLASGRLAEGRGRLPARFAHSILPIALGYVVAHYYSLAVTEGQRTIILAADPLGTGTNLLGRSTTDVNTALVTATGVATLQVAAVVTGHIAGAVAAHDRAVRLFPPRLARWGQLPLLLLMVGYTYLGLTLLFAA